MTKVQAKEKIKKIIDKYEIEKAASKVSKYNEEETKRGFIEPLFEALGWNFSDRQEVTLEENISDGRADYGFYLNGRIKFYLEAKPLRADLYREDYAKKTIHYSWNKGVTWAILSDFEGLIIFNALSPEKSLAGKKYLSFTYDEYLVRFDELWLLSKEAFSEDILDEEAEKVGKKIQKVSVTETLSKDLNECREILTKSFSQWNEKIDYHLIDEGVQKLLNRLIFIRSAEDRKIEPSTLVPIIHEWKSSNKAGKITLYQTMIKKFRELDEVYNSNLFAEHPFEKWEEFDGATEKVIDILYGKKNYLEYDFSIIPADVLGNVYENYLGHQLKKSKKEEHLDKNLKKRKEQGIYYTPKFIVDYIVQNTLGPVLDKCKSINDLQKIKILDPACGSGSFLVAAMNFLVKKYEEFNVKPNGLLKIQILQSNIYGVDLDQQAVELARLNLVLNTFDSQVKLPGLDNNIKNGNSLISGADEELKKYFGKNFCDKKPFNWQEEFPEVFKQGGFDAIIGNPPYVDSEEMIKTQSNFRKYCNDIYKSANGNWDLFCLFFERGLNLLKDGGQIGLIVPNKLISAKYAEETRKLINKNKIIAIRDYSKMVVFGASVYPIVIIIQKGGLKDNIVEIITDTQKNIKQSLLFNYKEGWSPVFSGNLGFKFLDKIIKENHRLDEIFNICGAATVGEAYEIKKLIKELHNEKKYFKFINTGTIDRYVSLWNKGKTQYIKDAYKNPIIEKESLKNLYLKRHKDSLSNKIIIAGMSKILECFLDGKGEYLAGKSTTIIIADIKKLKLLIAILNSKLLTLIYSYMFKSLSLAGGYFRIGAPQIKSLPIILPHKEQMQKILNLVDKMLKLNKEFHVVTENSDQWRKIKDEIAKTDKKIDEEVYNLYGLTEREIKIIEAK